MQLRWMGVGVLLLTSACTSLSGRAAADFSVRQTCPEDRVTVRESAL
jgi:hypothetical protein